MANAAKGAALLYVEDEAETKELIVKALEACYPSLKLWTAANGAEGLQLFRDTRPQLVLTDIRMPLMDGIEMAAEIKALDPEVHIIGLTAYNDTRFLSTAADIGFSECILKPVEYRILFASIDKFFRRCQQTLPRSGSAGVAPSVFNA